MSSVSSSDLSFKVHQTNTSSKRAPLIKSCKLSCLGAIAVCKQSKDSPIESSRVKPLNVKARVRQLSLLRSADTQAVATRQSVVFSSKPEGVSSAETDCEGINTHNSIIELVISEMVAWREKIRQGKNDGNRELAHIYDSSDISCARSVWIEQEKALRAKRENKQTITNKEQTLCNMWFRWYMIAVLNKAATHYYIAPSVINPYIHRMSKV